MAASLLTDSFLVGRAILRVLADSNQTTEIHRTEEITGRPRYRRILDEMRASPEGQRLLAERPELSSEQVDYDALRRLPVSTLGGAYVKHLDDHGLSADSQAAKTRHIDDPDMSYLMRRFRQTHDVWHALLGLGVTPHEEVIIHWFTYGQLRLPVSALVMVFGTMKEIVLARRWTTLRHSTREAYRLGRDAAPLLGVYWEDYWDESLDTVRAAYGVVPIAQQYLH
jgi:ubiquinone biosynthesis protein COQ4